MIVKVQISIFTNEAKRQILIYNEDRSVNYQEDADKDTIKLMDGELKKYFKATIKGKIIHLGKEVGEQEW